jgi:predicted RNA-binding Zn-ribbon protein involved in translation (DUF1610 family)
MPRRKTTNITGISRLQDIPFHDAWVAFICVNCKEFNIIRIGQSLLSPLDAYEKQQWVCEHCGFTHSKNIDLPFSNWPKAANLAQSLTAQRFWKAFFGASTEHPESYWKQCNVCGRVLPFSAFSKHSGWGPLQRQMECRGCKGAINAILNPERTSQQLFESSIKRRVAEMLLKGENEAISKNFIDELFQRFGGRCFKTKKPLNKNDRSSWAIDHILPSKYLYPLKVSNAALLSKEANDNKRDRWPSEFYTNNELIELAKITGGDLALLSSTVPIVNPNINVDACVTRALSIREGSNLQKRISELKKMLISYGLMDKLSDENKKLLGYNT